MYVNKIALLQGCHRTWKTWKNLEFSSMVWKTWKTDKKLKKNLEKGIFLTWNYFNKIECWNLIEFIASSSNSILINLYF